METVWSMLAFRVSVLMAVGVGTVALVTGNAPALVMLKAGVALLAFGTLGWAMNTVFFIVKMTPRVRESLPQAGDGSSAGDSPAGDQTPESG